MSNAFSFSGPVWEWRAKRNTFFVSVPEDIAEEIRARFGGQAAGFGSLRVEVTVGPTTWQTSVFPEQDGAGYALPLKKAVRDAADLAVGDSTDVTLRVLV